MEDLLNQLDMLDVVLAVFGALIVAMWRGYGKSWKGILAGAFMGGFVKPMVFTALTVVGMAALSGGDDQASTGPTDEQASSAMTKLFNIH
jgi:hypothetical protein